MASQIGGAIWGLDRWAYCFDEVPVCPIEGRGGHKSHITPHFLVTRPWIPGFGQTSLARYAC